MNKLFLFFIFMTSVILKVYSQDLPPEVESGYSSFSMPNANKYVPVNLNTGAVNIQIPLYTAESGSLKLPVSANYTSNGIRTFDLPSSLGLYWKLSAGGQITQIVRGKNDLGQAVDQDDILNPTSSFMRAVDGGIFDAEPDLYRVNSPGFGFDFMLSENETFVKLTENNIKVEFINPLYRFGGFKLIDDAGTEYYFNKRKTNTYKTGEDDDTKYTYSFTWFLSKIINANKTDSILIDYYRSISSDDEYTLCCGNHYSGIETVLYNQTKSYSETEQYVVSFDMMTLVKTIESNNERISFEYFTPEDYSSPYSKYEIDQAVVYESSSKDKNIKTHDTEFYNRDEKFLKSIIIKNKNNEPVKEYDFSYYVNSFNRVFLNKVTEKGNNGETLPPYEIKYIQPDETGEIFSDKKDFWGYYNPGTNSSIIANLFPVYNIPAGMPEKIYYPSGAVTKYFYEPNTYSFETDTLSIWYNEKWKNILQEYNHFYFEEIHNMRAGGFRVRRIENIIDGELTSKNFDYNVGKTSDGDAISSGRLTAYPEHKINYDYLVDSDTFNVEIISSDNFGAENSYVNYGKVTVYENTVIDSTNGIISGKNGKTEYIYNLPEPEYFYKITYHLGREISNNLPYDVLIYPDQSAGLLEQKTVFDSRNRKISNNISDYKIIKDTTKRLYGLKVLRKEEPAFEYYYNTYNNTQTTVKLNTVKTKSYKVTDTSLYMTDSIKYLYYRNNKEYLYPVEITGTNSKGDTLKTVLYYPEDFAEEDDVFKKMTKLNILSPVVKKEMFKNGERISGEKTVFRFHITATNDTLTVPSYVQILEEGNYKTVKWFDQYNDKGQLTEFHSTNGIHNCILYGYFGTLPVATAVNATYQQVFDNMSQEDFSVLNNPASDNELRNVIDELREKLPDAYISSATFKPLIGKTSETDANGISVYRDYDNFGRIKHIYDQDSILIKSYEYNLKHSHYPYDPLAVSNLYLAPGNAISDTLYYKEYEINVKWDTLVLLDGDFVNIDFVMNYPTQKTIRLAQKVPTENGKYSFIPEQHDSTANFSAFGGKFVVSCDETPEQADTSMYNISVIKCPWLTYPAPQQTIYRNYNSSINITWEPLYNNGYNNYGIKFIPDNPDIAPITIIANIDKSQGELNWVFNLRLWERIYDNVPGKIRIFAADNPDVYEDSGQVVIGNTL